MTETKQVRIWCSTHQMLGEVAEYTGHSMISLLDDIVSEALQQYTKEQETLREIEEAAGTAEYRQYIKDLSPQRQHDVMVVLPKTWGGTPEDMIKFLVEQGKPVDNVIRLASKYRAWRRNGVKQEK